MLNHVRFCDRKVENKKKDCRWYKETTKIVEAKKHIYEPLIIDSILISVNMAVKLYKLNGNQFTLGKEYYGPDFIDCISETYTHFEIKNHSKIVKVIKICSKINCESLHLPDENTLLFKKLADSNTECRVAYNSIFSFKIPDGVAITFYREKNNKNIMGPFTGPTMVSDKYKSFETTIHQFRYIKIENTDTNILQLCEGKDFTKECVYFYVANKKCISDLLIKNVLSMKIPKGMYIVVTKDDSTNRKFIEGNFNVPEEWYKFKKLQMFNTIDNS
nr:uncharacterized protein LOC124805885 [Hydra vulgaris]